MNLLNPCGICSVELDCYARSRDTNCPVVATGSKRVSSPKSRSAALGYGSFITRTLEGSSLSHTTSASFGFLATLLRCSAVRAGRNSMFQPINTALAR